VFLVLEKIHLLGPHGLTSVRDVVRHPGGVGVLPVDGDHVWFVRQYRVAVDAPVLEIPAGKRDLAHEPPEDTARRELEEELGLRARRLVPLGRMLPSPGYTDEVIHLFAADGVEPGRRSPDGAEEETAEPVRIALAEALRMLDSGEIIDAKTQIALMAWARLG
jgi:ADP-ribose pyrophosphatase